MRIAIIFLLACVGLVAADTKSIELTMPDLDLNSPAMFVKFLSEKIVAEPNKPETGLYINYMASYLVLLVEKKNFDHEIFATLNRVAPAIAKLQVGSIIIPSGNSAWKSQIISDPYGALSNRPFLSYYFYYFFEEAKNQKEIKYQITQGRFTVIYENRA